MPATASPRAVPVTANSFGRTRDRGAAIAETENQQPVLCAMRVIRSSDDAASGHRALRRLLDGDRGRIAQGLQDDAVALGGRDHAREPLAIGIAVDLEAQP